MKYWSGVFAMTGAAMLATAIFAEQWQKGILFGFALALIGAFLNSLTPVKAKKRRTR